MQRSDLAEKLLDKYNQMNPSCNENNWPALNGPGSDNNYAFSFMEIMIAQNSMLEQIIDNQETKCGETSVLGLYGAISNPAGSVIVSEDADDSILISDDGEIRFQEY